MSDAAARPFLVASLASSPLVPGLLAMVAAATAAATYAPAEAAMSGHHHATHLPGSMIAWVAMMVGMMIPVIAPTVATFGAVSSRLASRREGAVNSLVFLSGYLLAWSLFGLAAAAAQAGLRHILTWPAPVAAAAPWLVAGVYQLTPLKLGCLSKCESPLRLLLADWRPGAAGALRMGLANGLSCLGCCWGLMGLMFVSGAMATWAMAAITALMLLERALPFASAARLLGAGLIATGLLAALDAG
jgi:predicted metal-binding membrane protein